MRLQVKNGGCLLALGGVELFHQAEELLHVAHLDLAHVGDAVGEVLELAVAIGDAHAFGQQKFVERGDIPAAGVIDRGDGLGAVGIGARGCIPSDSAQAWVRRAMEAWRAKRASSPSASMRSSWTSRA